jgi:hypothetical protein
MMGIGSEFRIMMNEMGREDLDRIRKEFKEEVSEKSKRRDHLGIR